ncbi:MAG: hypothetical protein ACOYNI_07750 [Acidimicrobiia bacterium]
MRSWFESFPESAGSFVSRSSLEWAEAKSIAGGEIAAAAEFRVQIVSLAFTSWSRRRALARAIGKYAALGDPDALDALVSNGLQWLTPSNAREFDRTRHELHCAVDDVADSTMQFAARHALARWVESGERYWAVHPEAGEFARSTSDASLPAASITLLEPYLAALVRSSAPAAQVIHEQLAPLVAANPRAGRVLVDWTKRNVGELAGRPFAVSVVGDLLDRATPNLSERRRRAVRRLEARLDAAFEQSVRDVRGVDR